MSESYTSFRKIEEVEKRRVFYSFLFPSIFVVILLLVKLIEIEFDLNLTHYGVLPRTISGLKGIFFSPMIHGDWNHLFNNSIPLLILGAILFYFYKEVAFRLIVLSYLLAGLYTWISARNSYHIGASGLVYALFGFLFISGFIRKHIPLIALSFLVAFLYGSLIWGVLPWKKGVSWEGHFWGLFIGILLAFFYKKEGPQRKEFQWEDDGEILPNNDSEHQESTKNIFSQNNVTYHFIEKKQNGNKDESS